MRHLPALMLALLTATAGCGLFGGKRPAVPHASQRPPVRGAAASAEVVFLDVAVVDRPAGDGYLDREVWESGDEQGIELELKPLLEGNGLRVCQFGQLLPDRLQAMLASPRFCPAPRRYRNEPDKPTALQVGPVRQTCSFTLRPGEPKPLTFAQARCEFEVLPTLDDDGHVRLRITPRVRHGKPQRETKVARDPDGQLRWAMESAEPTQELTDLRVELRVASGEYVALGAWHDRPGTWGQACFAPSGSKTQHLLVLRASRTTQGDEPAGLTAPLALQASRTAARGASQR